MISRHLSGAIGTIVLTGFCLATTAGSATRTWSIAVCGPASDPRRQAVAEAVEFWNDQLGRIPANLRLGPITDCGRVFPDKMLRQISEGVLKVGRVRRLLPKEFDAIDADIIVALSGADLISVGVFRTEGRPGLVVLRRPDITPLSLPNVARNVAAHELGHVLGLPHSSDPTQLMCGRPASCRPALFQSKSKLFFPVTESELKTLADRFR